MLAVVQDEQCLLVADGLHERLDRGRRGTIGELKGRRDLLWYERGIADRREIHPADASEPSADIGGCFARQTRLAAPTGAREGEQAPARQHPRDLAELSLAADESRQVDGP